MAVAIVVVVALTALLPSSVRAEPEWLLSGAGVLLIALVMAAVTDLAHDPRARFPVLACLLLAVVGPLLHRHHERQDAQAVHPAASTS